MLHNRRLQGKIDCCAKNELAKVQLQELKDNQLWPPPTPCWEKDAWNETAKRIEKVIDKCKALSQRNHSIYQNLCRFASSS